MSRFLVIAPDGKTVQNVIAADPARVPELEASGLVLVLDRGPAVISPGDEVRLTGPAPVVTRPAAGTPLDRIVIGGETYELRDRGGGEFVLVKVP